jgi:multidrug efflux pump
MNFSRFFVDKPIFAAVLSIIIFVAGLMSIFKLPISEYPDVVPPSVVVRAQYPGANPKIIAETVAAPLEEQINGVENMLYMSSQNTSDGALALTVTFKIGTNVEQAETQVQNRVQRALAAPAGRGAPDRCDHREGVAQPDHGGPPAIAERPLRRPLSAQLRSVEHQGPAGPPARHGRGAAVRFRRLRDAHLARTRRKWHARHDRQRRRRRDPRAERASGSRCHRPGSPSKGADFQLTVNTQGRLQSEEEFGDIILRPMPTAR